ncbi:PP2C family protein-serine/threonine phosphatase [Piscinibacter sakaiensis]|uniref:PP2C family protein-serine/threonine phosphatase n=1 Tax=Piscinibacter sakaiensis TaxID=1547922 RepID=UPI0006B4400F|nr:PP2C family serine/threonine-protein phosphatase [Piscinibacter sakaiensis]
MVRSGNEDAVYGHPGLGLAVLADGMGGYAAGEVASRLAVDEIRAELESALPHLDTQSRHLTGEELKEDLRFAARRANGSILAAAKREPDYEGMGATLVIAVLTAARLFVGHLGDSRCYRFRAGRIEQLTRDHCWVDEQISAGALQIDALLDTRFKNVVTRALGIDEDVDLEVHEHATEPGDVYLLCSDGLSDMLDDAQMEQILGGTEPLAAKVDALIERANRNGGKDNVSVILLREAAPRTHWASRLVKRIQGVAGGGAGSADERGA